MMPTTAMLFAAGLGTRMRPLTEDRPKPLVEVAGRPLIDHALALLVAAGVPRAVVNTHYRAEQIAAHLAGVTAPAITLSHEQALLETGGGIRNARTLLGEAPILTLNTDAVFAGSNPVQRLSHDWRDGMEALLLLIPRERAVGHIGPGDFGLDAAGRLIRRGAALTAPYVYVGAQIIAPGAAYAMDAPAFSLNPVWDGMIARGTAFGTLYAGRWCDVGQPASIPLAEGLLA